MIRPTDTSTPVPPAARPAVAPPQAEPSDRYASSGPPGATLRPASAAPAPGRPVEAEETETPLPLWRRALIGGLAALSVASALGGAPAVAMGARPAVTRSRGGSTPTEKTLQEIAERGRRQFTLRDLLRPAQSPTRPAPAPATLAETRERLAHLDFPNLDPYAASVAGSIWSGQNRVSGQDEVLSLPGRFRQDLPVEVGLQHGPGAPMLVILPGLGAGTGASHAGALKRMAAQNGMNFAVLPNPWSRDWIQSGPAGYPGNLPWEAEAAHAALEALAQKHPGYFDRVSLTGYSYGAIQGAALLKHEAGLPREQRIVNGSMAVLSPPVRMTDSMARLDGLRNEVFDSMDWIEVAELYSDAVKTHGYEGLMESPIARRPNYGAERFLADSIGSRSSLQEVAAWIDGYSGRNLLPYNAEVAKNGPVKDPERAEELQMEQDWTVGDATYGGYMADYLAHDPTLAGRSPEQLTEDYRYTRLLDEIAGKGIPVLTLASADDYILKPQNVADLRQREAAGPADQAARVLEHGGHVGALLNPAVRQGMVDFLKQPPKSDAPRWAGQER